MKIILSLGVFLFALSLCNLAERFTKQKTSSDAASNSNVPTVSNSSSASNTASGVEQAETYSLTPEQTAVAEKGKEIKWDAQGISWKVPASWKQSSSTPTTLVWSSGDGAFLIASISPMAADFPAEISLKANHDGAVTRQKNGELDKLRYLELDGVKGIEFIESMSQGASSPRRQQWIAFRNYAGQLQMVNLMLSTNGSNFDKKCDEFAAIMSSTKLVK